MTAQKRPKKGDRLRAFATVRYWIGQLNESGIKHDISIATSTKDLYLYHLVMFDEWLAGRGVRRAGANSSGWQDSPQDRPKVV